MTMSLLATFVTARVRSAVAQPVPEGQQKAQVGPAPWRPLNWVRLGDCPSSQVTGPPARIYPASSSFCAGGTSQRYAWRAIACLSAWVITTATSQKLQPCRSPGVSRVTHARCIGRALTASAVDCNAATADTATGVKWSVGSRHRFGSPMDSYSIRFASGRISPNLDPQVCDCWLDTTGELHRAQRPGRYKARDALSMPRGQRASRNGRPPPPRQTVYEAPPRLPGECCRPNRWRRGDRLAPAAHALHSRPAHSTAARRAKARTRSPAVE